MRAQLPPRPDVRRRRLQVLVATTIVGVAALDLAGPNRRQPPELAALAVPSGDNIHIEIARTSEQRARGLSGRSRIKSDGLLLVWPDAGGHPIWMADMRFALDLVWLDPDHRVLAIMPDAQPCTATPCPLFRPPNAGRAVAVLELPSGDAARYLIAVNATVEPSRPESRDSSTSTR